MTRTTALPRLAARATAALAIAAALALGGAAAAQAHVSVDASSNEGGSRSILTFRVPTESDTASTTGLRVQLPTETPFLSVRVEQIAGWTAELVKGPLDEPADDGHGNEITEAVTEVIWTATGDGIAPDAYAEFTISVNPLPESGTLFFPTVQSYSDGHEVDWVQQAEGDAEPEKPAPSLKIVAASGDSAEAAGDEHGAEEEATAISAEHVEESGSGSGDALALAITALVVALLGAAAGGWALVRTRK